MCIRDSYQIAHHSAAATSFHVPFFKTVALPLGSAGFVLLGYLMIVGSVRCV